MSTPPAHDDLVAPGESGESGARGRPAGPTAGGARHPALRDAAAVLGVYVALGLVAGVVWWALYDPAVYTVSRDGRLGMGEAQLGKRFNADGWYAVIAAVAGLVSGTAVSWWRARDPLLSALLVLIGSALAATTMAVVGGWLGPPDPQTVAAAAGDTVPLALEVDAAVCYLVFPVTALIGSLIVLWSPPTTDPV